MHGFQGKSIEYICAYTSFSKTCFGEQKNILGIQTDTTSTTFGYKHNLGLDGQKSKGLRRQIKLRRFAVRQIPVDRLAHVSAVSADR